MRVKPWIQGPGMLAVIGLVAWAVAGRAGATTWTGAVSGDWTDADNWTAGVPGPSDTAMFADEDPGTLAISVPRGGDAPAQEFRFLSGTGNVTITGTGTGNWDLPAAGFEVVAEAGSGANTINLGTGQLRGRSNVNNYYRNYSTGMLTLNLVFDRYVSGAPRNNFDGSGDITVSRGLGISSGVVTLLSSMTGSLIVPIGWAATTNSNYVLDGGTWVQDGTMTVRSNSLAVNAATMTGTGRIGTPTTANNHRFFDINFNNGSVLDPGSVGGAGTLTFENRDLNLHAGSMLRLDLLNTSSHDRLVFARTSSDDLDWRTINDEVVILGVVPSMNLSGTGAGVALHINLLDGFEADLWDVFTILSGYTAVNGTFAGLADGTAFDVGDHTFRIDYGESATTLTVIPEPGVSALMLLAGLGLALARRRVRA